MNDESNSLLKYSVQGKITPSEKAVLELDAMKMEFDWN